MVQFTNEAKLIYHKDKIDRSTFVLLRVHARNIEYGISKCRILKCMINAKCEDVCWEIQRSELL